MRAIGLLKTVARTQMLELGELSDKQLKEFNEICQTFYDIGHTDGRDLIFANCKVIYREGHLCYPIEHNPDANKESRKLILAAIKKKE